MAGSHGRTERPGWQVAHLVCALLAAVFAAFTLAFAFGWSESSGTLHSFTIVLAAGVSVVLACATASLIFASVDLARHFSPRGRIVWTTIMLAFWTGANAVVIAGGIGKAVGYASMADRYSNNDVARARYDMYFRRVWGEDVVVPWPFWALSVVFNFATAICIGVCLSSAVNELRRARRDPGYNAMAETHSTKG